MGNLDHESIRLDLGDVQRVKPPAGTEGMRTKVETGDILISITADVGMIAVVPASLGDAYINQHVSLARPLNGFCREYLAWYLVSHDGGQKMFLQLQRGATKVGLGLDDIRAVPVPFPPLAEQQEILAEIERRLSVIEQLTTVVESNLIRANRLRQSVLERAFSGCLVPADPKAESASVLLSQINTEGETVVNKTKLHQYISWSPEQEVIMADLIEALRGSDDWVKAQDAFRLCGISDGADTDAVEHIFAQLRECIHLGQIEVERRGEQDWFRLAENTGG